MHIIVKTLIINLLSVAFILSSCAEGNSHISRYNMYDGGAIGGDMEPSHLVKSKILIMKKDMQLTDLTLSELRIETDPIRKSKLWQSYIKKTKRHMIQVQAIVGAIKAMLKGDSYKGELSGDEIQNIMGQAEDIMGEVGSMLEINSNICN